MTGVSTYNVTPARAALYFHKIQCFCFEEQRLNAGETVDMPVFFYIDPEFEKDIAVRNIGVVTLHYTFFSEFVLSMRGRANEWQKRDMINRVICIRCL